MELSGVATIVDAKAGTAPASAGAIRARIAAGHFFWLDIYGGEPADRDPLLRALDLPEATIGRIQRFGQTCRMQIGAELRAATWLVGQAGELIETHLLCTPCFVVTAWTGDAAILDEVCDRFARRVVGLDHSHYQAAGILLQLLLSTLDRAISEFDARLDDYQARVDAGPSARADPARAAGRVTLESIWASFDHYASIVRSAVTGVEAVPGMDQRGAAELNDYAELVADVEHRLHNRIQWLTSILRNYAAHVAEHQSDQINRLTLVSVIFLPITFLTGFFGMNFNWMIANIDGRRAFVLLGIALPVACVALIVALFRRRGLLPGRRARAVAKPPALLTQAGPPTAER